MEPNLQAPNEAGQNPRPVSALNNIEMTTQAALRSSLLLGLLLTFVSIVPVNAEPQANPDARISLVDKLVEGRYEAALALVEERLATDPERAQKQGLPYLKGHLLLALGRRAEAFQAFAATMKSTPELGPYSRLRLAVEQERDGHPELAAGLVAELLRASPPRSLATPAVRLLRTTLASGADCGVLRGIEPHRFRRSERREIQHAIAECQRRAGDEDGALQTWVRLLEEKTDDPVARFAAEQIVSLGADKLPPRTHMLVGLSFYNHREFDTAVHHLARCLVQRTNVFSRREIYELRYALARSHFWAGRYQAAAGAFAALAKDTVDAKLKAKALYQQGRCFELAGLWDRAIAVFATAYRTAPTGGWSDSALIAHLRLQWLSGREDDALDNLDEMLRRRKYGTASRALIFVASSDIVRGRHDRAGSWLQRAASLRRVPSQELYYWRGRLAELQQKPKNAVEAYVRAFADAPYNPFGTGAYERLQATPLAPVRQALASELAKSKDPQSLYRAWILAKPGTPSKRQLKESVRAAFSASSTSRTFLTLTPQPTAEWPLWQSRPDGAEHMLLSLGLFKEGSRSVLRLFPVSQPGLAMSGSRALHVSGDTRRSLYVAEILKKRVPRSLPDKLLSTDLRKLLFPMPWQELIVRESERQLIDPNLLAAVIREESRFDPTAFSAAAARGLTQFIFSTAEEIASGLEIGPIQPRDLDRPEISIALGAAYFRRLADNFSGNLPEMIAAYNAGEPQATLWRQYCHTNETEEYLSKVAFRETRGYLNKVLTSRAHYSDLYPASPSSNP